MRRRITDELIRWKNTPGRKPLIVEGARQVGKTYVLKEFGYNHYQDFAYFNFEEEKKIHAVFKTGSLNPHKILDSLSILRGKKIESEKTLIFFDEIQECGEAITSLKYFFEEAPKYSIVCAGSLLGLRSKVGHSFPVGKVSFLELFPLSFEECIAASGNTLLEKRLIEGFSRDEPIPPSLHQELLDFLTIYFFTGGMPEVVRSYFEKKDHQEVRRIQKEILRTYELDFAKHAGKVDAVKISKVWQSLPVQLAKANRKFQYSKVEKRARSREFELAVQWLKDAHLIHICSEITKPTSPLSAYGDVASFKVYLLDVGLLGALAEVNPTLLLEGMKYLEEFKGALAENFVAQELATIGIERLYYWNSGQDAEIDFLVENVSHLEPVPLEVKSGSMVRSKSMGIYRKKYNPPWAIRASLLNFEVQPGLLNVPLYAVGRAATARKPSSAAS